MEKDRDRAGVTEVYLERTRLKINCLAHQLCLQEKKKAPSERQALLQPESLGVELSLTTTPPPTPLASVGSFTVC